jgi:WD40 repeat protein
MSRDTQDRHNGRTLLSNNMPTDLARELQIAEAKKANTKEKAADAAPQATFHGKAATDWQGRSWMAPPKDKRKELNEKCFLPKRWIHTWSGHTKGVNAIRFFPTSGHLLLSAGLDSKVKIWDVHGSGKCLQTYHGHSQGVRDVTFNRDGTKFLSTAYDKQVQVCISTSAAICNCLQPWHTTMHGHSKHRSVHCVVVVDAQPTKTTVPMCLPRPDLRATVPPQLR